MIAAFAGSFDPPTLGHLSIIERASRLFDGVVVLAAANSAKHNLFSLTQRLDWLKQMSRDLPNVQVFAAEGLSVDAARAHGADVLLRAIRNASDLDGELNNRFVNTQLEEPMETVFLAAEPRYTYISSSNVREMLKYHQNVSSFVPACVWQDLQQKNTADHSAAL